MADFTTLQEADASSRAKVLDGTYTEAHGAYKSDGTAVVVMRALNKVTAANGGEWLETVVVPT